MRKVLLYTQEELDKLAKNTVTHECGRDAVFKNWELEISNSDWPKLHVYYYHMSDGQGLHLVIKPLEGPKS